MLIMKTHKIIFGFYLFALIAIQASDVMAQGSAIAYIHGDVSAQGDIPSGNQDPFHQMLLTDTGRLGMSDFAALVRSQGHTIEQFLDTSIDLTPDFLNRFDVLIFGLHQALYPSNERAALADWLEAGGGMMIYSDSASGGRFSLIRDIGGAQNTVGQMATNNLIAEYGMQVTVDQANGTFAQTAPSNSSVIGGLTIEGEGVSPVAISPIDSSIEILIPYTQALPHPDNITINNPSYAAVALKTVNQGHIAVVFDRQPYWNNGDGSDITRRDNTEVLRRLVNFLAQRPIVDTPSPQPPSGDEDSPLQVLPSTILLIID